MDINFRETIENTIVQDKIIKIDSDEITNANTIKVKLYCKYK